MGSSVGSCYHADYTGKIKDPGAESCTWQGEVYTFALTSCARLFTVVPDAHARKTKT